MKTKRLCDFAVASSIVFIMLCYVLSDFYSAYKSLAFPVCGIMGMVVTIFCVLRGKLWASYDTVILCAFLCLSLISSTLAGVDLLEFFCSRYFSFWMFCLAMYFASLSIFDGKRAMGIFFFFSSLVLCYISVYAILHASASILAGTINEDVVKGCFSGGRLYALGNANTIGNTSAGHILVSIAGFLGCEKRNKALRVFYIVSTFIGWLTLGLSGCRTGRISVALAISMFCFVMLVNKAEGEKKKLLLAAVMAALVLAATLLSFTLPNLIYKGVMSLIGLVFGIDVFKDLGNISLHRIVDDDGTMTGRMDLWIAGVKSYFKNARRFFFGISPISVEPLSGITPGHHEIKGIHPHNAYIEIFRKHGLFGFVALMSLIIAWVVNCLSILFSKEKKSFDIFIIFMIFAVMLIGMAEVMPFISSTDCYISLLFFITCGYCMRVGRSRL